MIEAVLGMSILTVVRLSTGVSLLRVSRVVRTGWAWLLATDGRGIVALRILVIGLRRRLQQVSFKHTFGQDDCYTLAVGVCG